MQWQYITFKPVAEVRLTQNELDILLALASRHYDGHCRATIGPNGFVTKMRSREANVPGLTHSLTWQEIDTLAKLAEIYPTLPDQDQKLCIEMGAFFRRLLVEMNEAAPPPLDNAAWRKD